MAAKSGSFRGRALRGHRRRLHQIDEELVEAWQVVVLLDVDRLHARYGLLAAVHSVVVLADFLRLATQDRFGGCSIATHSPKLNSNDKSHCGKWC